MRVTPLWESHVVWTKHDVEPVFLSQVYLMLIWCAGGFELLHI